MKDCPHENFSVQADVNRLCETEGGPITAYCMDLKVQCDQCKQAFEFIGVPAGYNPAHPCANADFTQLNVPIRPATGQIATKLTYKMHTDKVKHDG